MWEKHQTADGAVYYQDVAQGLVQWNVPDDYESKGDAKGTELDEEEFAEFSEYTMEDEFLFELQSLGMFTKQRDANLSSSSVWQEALPKIAFLKEKLEEGVGTDGDWEIAMSTNNFALVHYLTRLLDERVDVGVSSMAMQCLAFVGTLYPKVWVDFVHDEHHLHCLFQSVAFLTTKLIMLASTKKIAKSSSSPYLGFDERDIADFNLEGFEREEVVDETTHGVSGMEGHDDQDTSILVCLMLFSQYFGREISLLKCTIDTSTTTPEDIESMCRLSEEDVKGELSAFCASGISSGKNIKVLCRALLLILPSLTEDAYLLAIKAIASLNRQSPVFDALQSTEIAKMCTVSHFDSNNGVNISEVSS